MTASGSPVSRAECLFTMRSKIDANLRSILLTLASVSRSAIQRASRANAVIASISDALYIDGCLSETKVSADCIADPGVGLQVQRGLLSVRLVAESLMTAIAGFSIDDEGPNGSLGAGVLRAAPLCKAGRVNSHDERDLVLELLR